MSLGILAPSPTNADVATPIGHPKLLQLETPLIMRLLCGYSVCPFVQCNYHVLNVEQLHSVASCRML